MKTYSLAIAATAAILALSGTVAIAQNRDSNRPANSIPTTNRSRGIGTTSTRAIRP